MKKKKRIITGWVHNIELYSYFGHSNEYVAKGEVINRKKRFDTPYKIRVTVEKIKEDRR